MNQSKVTSSFRRTWYGLYFSPPFYFSLLLSIGKRSTLAKIWWELKPPQAPPPPQFLRVSHKYRSEYNAAKFSSKFFYNKKLELSEKILERNSKIHAQNWKISVLYIYWEYLFYLQSNASSSFLQTSINFVEQRTKYLKLILIKSFYKFIKMKLFHSF